MRINQSAPPSMFRSMFLALAALLSLVPNGIWAQAPGGSSVEAQHAAMQKLAFLVGRWSGPATVSRGPGEPTHVTQTENVQFKLDGLVLLIEGRSTDVDGKSGFSALATVAYDDASHAYRFRAYNGGHYLDTELTVTADGFSWSYESGPAHVVNTMHVTEKGEWSETTEATYGGHPPMRAVEMLLRHQQ